MSKPPVIGSPSSNKRAGVRQPKIADGANTDSFARGRATDYAAEAERIRDIIGTALVAGTNITIDVDDPGDTITINSTASGALSDGDYGDITVGGSGTTLTIDNDVVTNAKLANVATATFKGRVTAGTGDPEDLTGTQATTLIDLFTSSLKGLVPGSGGGTSNFLRADGTWQVPGGGGNVTTTGSPASGNLTKFSGATSITNGDLSGDVTTSGTLAATIANDAVTYAKMQDISATSRVLGRKTSGAGNTEECTLSDILDFIGSAVQGDILYRGASSWARLAAGTLNFKLISGGASANPSWVGFRGALVHKAADQTGANYSSTTVIAWDSETNGYDTDAIHDNSTNNSRLTVPSGVTRVRLQYAVIGESVAANADFYTGIRKNGSVSGLWYTGTLSDTSSASPRNVGISPVLTVTSGDYFEVELLAVGDSSISIYSAYSFFAMEIIE